MTKILDAMESGMDVKAAIDRSPIRPLQVAVIMICFTLNVLDGFDVVAIAFAAPAISNDWQMSLTLLGLVFSAGLAGMTIGAMFLAPLTDIVGRRNMILIALLIISSTMVITATVHEIWQLVIMRSLTGLGIGSMLASLTSMTAEFVPNRKRNFAISLVQAGYPVGATCGGFIAAWLIPYVWLAVTLLRRRHSHRLNDSRGIAMATGVH
jgi:AAHS family 4-hydroxybenzoate transporter-like MFS transporter